jgi:predicted  nucleic acid-binding Zn-ribbon protein
LDPHELDLTLAKLRDAADLYRELARARREQSEGRRRARDLADADREFEQDEHAASAELRRRRQDARRLEDELQGLENKLSDRRTRPASDPGTVLALADEIRGLEARHEELERRLLEVWREAEAPPVARDEGWSREDAALRHREQVERADKAARAIAEVEGELDHQLGKLPPRVGRKVAQIARRHPDPVADLVEGSCGGCGQSLPPQEAVDADSERALITCQGCGRFVVARSGRRIRGRG